MSAGRWDFSIEQGATFQRTLTWKDAADVLVPLLGKTARMQLRTKVPDVVVLLELTTENGRITLSDPGVIELFVTAEDTALLDFKTAQHDLEIADPSYSPEYVVRLLEGTVQLSKEVTRT